MLETDHQHGRFSSNESGGDSGFGGAKRGGAEVFWYDAQTGPAFRPPGIPEDEPLIGGPGSFGARGQAFSGGGAAGPAPGAAVGPPQGGPPEAARGGRAGRGGHGGAGSQNNGAVFIGDKGILTTDTYGANCRLLPQARNHDYRLPPEFLTRSPGHYRDWIRAGKGGEPACSNFSVAGPFTEWIVLGVVALHFEGKLEWDAAKMKITNPEDNR
jgi:hypothetical protein